MSIINIDSDVVEISIEDVGILPAELVNPLHSRLDRIVVNWKRTCVAALYFYHKTLTRSLLVCISGTGIWEARELMRAFLSFFVGIFGTYRRFFQQLPDGSAKFDREAFCASHGPRIQKVFYSTLSVYSARYIIFPYLSMFHASSPTDMFAHHLVTVAALTFLCAM